MPVPKVQICDETVTHENVAALMAVGAAGVPLREVYLGRIAPDAAALARVPKFDTFLGDVPPPPVSKSWVNDAAKASLKQMLGNDQEGDCVIASLMHGEGVSSANESGTAVLSSTQEALSEYHRVCGPGDNGCVITDVKDAMMSGGVSVGGTRRKIDGYAAVNPANKVALQTAILLAGGGCNFGFNVPSRWMGSNTYDGAFWDIAPNQAVNSVGGHDVRAVGYDDRGVQISTWGIIVTVSWRALADSRVFDEAYVELEKDWNSDGTAPSGLDTAGLAAALAAFKAGKVPDWRPPAPVPPPVPPTPPSGGLTGTETNVYIHGAIMTRTFVPGKAPVQPLDDDMTFDLSAYGLHRRHHPFLNLFLMDLVNRFDGVEASAGGGVFRIKNVGAPNWAAIIALIIQILAALAPLFGG